MGRAAFLLALLGLLAGTTSAFAEASRPLRVQFRRDATQATVNGTIVGAAEARYLVRAAAGQTLRVTLASRNGSLNFNVFAPGVVPGRGEALFSSTTSGNSAELRLTQAGDQMVQVFLMRNAARRNERARFTLRLAVTGGATASAPAAQARTPVAAPSHDARVAGTAFHATGDIPCARAAGQPMSSCQFGVVRAPGGGTVTVQWRGGGSRAIRFERGVPVGSDGGAVTFERREDLFMIRVGEERFEIPEAVITGG